MPDAISSLNTIGLIGGMSWESTAHYYRVLNEETARKMGGLHSAPLLLLSVDFALIENLQRSGKWEEAGNLLAAHAKTLEAGGAKVLGLATNTMHIVAERMVEGLSIPFVHIADPTADALLKNGISRAGLLGTRFTMEMDFYKDRLKARSLDVLVPDSGITEINRIIYDELCHGVVREESREVFVQAMNGLARRGAQAVILGCTEIAMLVDQASSPLPVFDTTDLHAKALVAAAMA
jgi:aspartate racemase